MTKSIRELTDKERRGIRKMVVNHCAMLGKTVLTPLVNAVPKSIIVSPFW